MPDSSKRDSRPPRVIVKFRDRIGLPDENDIGRTIEARAPGSWSRLKERFPGINIRPLYRLVSPSQIEDLSRRAKERQSKHPLPDLLTYFIVDCPPTVQPAVLAKALREWPFVQAAYPEPTSSVPDVAPSAYTRSGDQKYLNPDEGIDALFAFSAGGDGAGQQVIDVEKGWTLGHQDIVVHEPTILNGYIDEQSRPHGTSVLGVICGQTKGATPMDPAPGVVGIAPNVAKANVVSYKTNQNPDEEAHSCDIPDAIAFAAGKLPSGGVLVLEVQVEGDLPCETFEACLHTIIIATAAGVVVVEAAGNGASDLDIHVSPEGTCHAGKQILNRNNPDEFVDSGAIMVGAATSQPPHEPLSSCHGSRIDCYAWGENVMAPTSGSAQDTTSYDPNFNGTSAATAIVAGAALSVQSMAVALSKAPLAPIELRAILSDPSVNTASANPGDGIGVMPDLQEIYNWLHDQTGGC